VFAQSKKASIKISLLNNRGSFLEVIQLLFHLVSRPGEEENFYSICFAGANFSSISKTRVGVYFIRPIYIINYFLLNCAIELFYPGKPAIRDLLH